MAEIHYLDPPDVRRAKGVQQIWCSHGQSVEGPLGNSLHYSSSQTHPKASKQEYLNNAEESEQVSFGEHKQALL